MKLLLIGFAILMAFLFGKAVVRENDAYEDLERVNAALRHYGFEVTYNNQKRIFIAERRTSDWLYQVWVVRKYDKVEIDYYAFVNGSFKRSWAHDEHLSLVLRDLDRAITYYLEHKEFAPKYTFEGIWWWDLDNPKKQ